MKALYLTDTQYEHLRHTLQDVVDIYEESEGDYDQSVACSLREILETIGINENTDI